VGLGLPWSSSRLGLLRSGTTKSLQAGAANASTAAVMAVGRTRMKRGLCMMVVLTGRGLKNDFRAEPVAAARREGGDVDVPGDVLIAEVADFGIEPGVLRVRPQVAAAEAQRRAMPGAPELGQHVRRELVRQRHFAELQEAAVLHVHLGLVREVREPLLADRQRAPRLGIRVVR